MRWIICLIVILTLAHINIIDGSLDPKQTSTIWPKCESPCVQGQCINGTCVCQPGWTGSLCESCFGRIIRHDSSGYIIDGPSNYSKNMRCTWLLDGTAWNATSVTLRLDQFATECCWDHVYIYDGDGAYSKQLAALSGSMVASSNGAVKEYVARSGQAYVFFYSDLAYNMSGFNISYKFSSCPKDCSGRGTCEVSTGQCHCSGNWLGEACDEPACSAFCVNGKCSSDQRHCVCSSKFRGKFCNITIGEAVWLELDIQGPEERASHGVALVDKDLWVVHGSYFRGNNFSDVAKFDLSTFTWTPVVPLITAEFNVTPRLRYDHSVVHFDDKLYMFGGVIENKNVSCELWSFDLTNFTWKLITTDHHNHLHLPFHVSGHTAHVVNGLMVVIFGYNPNRGYLDVVQEYNFSNKSWNIVSETSSYRPTGTYGHSSVLDERSGNIFVYGGYGASSHSNIQLYDKLYQYQPVQRKWTILRTSGYPSFLHSAALLDRMMIVVGGNAHNESVASKQTKCYSDVVLVYDIECGTWNKLEYPTYLTSGLARYGHRAFVYEDNMYLYGGFNGNMLETVIKFTPGNCSHFREHDPCVNSAQGSKCVWSTKGRCLSITEADQFAKGDHALENKYDKACQPTGIGALIECSEHYDCPSCSSSGTQPCYWCNGKCTNHCSEGQTAINHCPNVMLNCSHFHSCISCKLHDKCTWDRRNKIQLICTDAVAVEKPNDNSVKDVLMKEQPNICPKPCSYFFSCDECSRANCLWCSTMARCVDTNAYITSFPYGQCTQWSNLSDECAETETCEAHLTCHKCQSAGPRCGWCDDGSRTGLGRCLNGGSNGPVQLNKELRQFHTNNSICLSEHWFFVECPPCQCNGHAVCRNDSGDLLETGRTLPCFNCSGETTGDQCDTCIDGFFGNALNGGNCSQCDCNNQATMCDSSSGRCHCTTKGVSGHNCDKCEQKYIGDPKNQSCYYELTVDFVFTFNLNSEDDIFITKINFVSRPPKENTDVTFKLTCNTGSLGEAGRVNLSVTSYSQADGMFKTRKFLSAAVCHEVERRFTAEEFAFGTDANTTFLVYLYDFKTPTIIQISFAQTATIDWMKFFVTFALCFFILLVLAFALWKIKQRVDLYRRRQRMFVEMAQMASRPFGTAQLDMTGGLANQKQWASAISVEPCANYRAAVVTVALRLPTGGRKFAPNGQSGLAVASTLCHITPSQLAQLQTPPSPLPEEKSKRRRPACIS